MPVDVFHHHHRGVDHHADGDGQAAQRHQIGSEIESIHHKERHERRHDERRRHDQGAPGIAQEHEEHDHHQENTLAQRLIDGRQRGGDQFDTIVKGNDPPSCRQQPLVLYLGDLAFDAFHDVAGVCAAQHEHDPSHHLALTVQDGSAMTNGMADLYLGDVMDVHGSAARFFDDDVLDVAQSPDHPHAADNVLFGMFLQHVARSIRVVVRHSGKHLAQREIVFAQQFGLDEHLVLFDIPAERVDVDHSRDALEQRTDDPVQHSSLFDQFAFHRSGVQTGMRRAFQKVLIHLSQSGAVRHHHRFRPGREMLPHFDQSLEYELAGKVDVHLIIEHYRNQRQSYFGERA